jgi:RNA polymerase sigma-70 factor, ECF subfamily
MQDDAGIIGQCLAGNTAAYRSLVDRHAWAVRGFLIRRLRDPSRTDDAVQETYVRAYERLADLREPDRFLSWVLGIAANVALEHLRREQREAPIPIEQPDVGASAPRDELLERAVGNLPEPYREAVRLRYWGGLSCEESAAALGVPLGTLTKRLSRAHTLLRGVLEGGTNENERREHHDELRAMP